MSSAAESLFSQGPLSERSTSNCCDTTPLCRHGEFTTAPVTVPKSTRDARGCTLTTGVVKVESTTKAPASTLVETGAFNPSSRVQVPVPCLVNDPEFVIEPVTAWPIASWPEPSSTRLLAASEPRFKFPLILPPVTRVTVLGAFPRFTAPLIVSAFEMLIASVPLVIAEWPLPPARTPPGLFVTDPLALPSKRIAFPDAEEIVPELTIVVVPPEARLTAELENPAIEPAALLVIDPPPVPRSIPLEPEITPEFITATD